MAAAAAIIAGVIGKAKPPVGVDRIESAVLQRIGADLVGETNPAAFLAKIKEDAATRPHR